MPLWRSWGRRYLAEVKGCFILRRRGLGWWDQPKRKEGCEIYIESRDSTSLWKAMDEEMLFLSILLLWPFFLWLDVVHCLILTIFGRGCSGELRIWFYFPKDLPIPSSPTLNYIQARSLQLSFSISWHQVGSFSPQPLSKDALYALRKASGLFLSPLFPSPELQWPVLWGRWPHQFCRFCWLRWSFGPFCFVGRRKSSPVPVGAGGGTKVAGFPIGWCLFRGKTFRFDN